ncbi:hypothetical protein [Staphylococcus epidermidis]|nr:hypothetical protein [Staphylococcus epidermidis]
MGNEEGVVSEFEMEGELGKYGNNESGVDEIGVDLVEGLMSKLGSDKR